MIKLDNRLKSLVKHVNKNDNIIDIGCDHALLDIYLVSNKIVDSIIISDISKNALEQGISNIKKYNLEDHIKYRCGNGLDVLSSKDLIDTVIISGMGTNNIINILNNKYLKNINKLIIQSNNDYYLLRKEIVKLGFIIKDEEVIESNNKIYLNIIFEKGYKKYTLNELKYGSNNMLNKNIYYEHLIKKYSSILNNNCGDEKYKELTREINYLEKLLNNK